MPVQRIAVQQLFDGITVLDNVAVVIEHGRIVGIDKIQSGESPLAGLLTAGFIDLQVNGGGGSLFNHDPSVDCLRSMMAAHSRFGTTAMLPTLITDSISIMHAAANSISDALHQGLAGIIGVHFEGPHLAEGKRGIHPAVHIRGLSIAEQAIYRRDDLGIKLVTVAPEQLDAADIQALVDADVLVSIGHSNAGYDLTTKALAAGASGFTHLFNAMSPLTSREPGVVGAALADPHSWCGLIMDGHHVHPATAKLALAAKPQGKMLLVTDAMSPVGTDQQAFEWQQQQVRRQGDKLTIDTGQLAGSVLDMATAVKNTVQLLGVELAEALRMASMYPAIQLGIDEEYGRVATGYRADLVLLDAGLTVTQTWICGEQVFAKTTSDQGAKSRI